MKLRYVNLGTVNPEYSYALWEYPRIFKVEYPTLFVYRINKTVIDVSGFKPIDYYLKLDAIPKDIKIQRFYFDDEVNIGAIYMSPNMICMIFITPDNYSKDIEYLSVLKILRKHGIKCYANHNDCFFEDDESDKKFFGIQFQDWDNGWISRGSIITFDLDTKLMNEIYKFDNDKFLKKDNFNNKINEIVGGLWKYNPNLDMDIISEEIAHEIASKSELEIYKDKLNDLEFTRLIKLANGLNDDWVYNLIHPELGKVQG